MRSRARRLVVQEVEPQRAYDPEGRNARDEPLRWPDVLDRVAAQWGGQEPILSRRRQVLLPGRDFVAWHPNSEALWPGLARRNLVYLCWGMPPEAGTLWVRALKRARLRWTLRLAQTVAVNDPTTAQEVAALSGRSAQQVPYLVDTDFFAYAPPEGRGEQVLIPGSMDRDEVLTRALAERGVPVIRVTRAPASVAFHRQRGPLTTLQIREDVPFTELRRLYQQVRAVLLPLTSRNHAAGQTSLLEAVACGAPVILSDGRVADIGRSLGTVLSCPDNEPATWMAALDQAKELLQETITRRQAERVAQIHHPDKVVASLLELLRSTAGPTAR